MSIKFLTKTSLFCFFSLFLGVYIAQANGGWIIDKKSGCKIWNPRPQPNETISYTGGCENGVADGHGTVIWFENGKQNGKPQTGNYVNGVLINIDGDYVSNKFPHERLISRTFDSWNEGSHFIMIRGKKEVSNGRYQIYYSFFNSEGKRKFEDDMSLIKLDNGRWIIFVGDKLLGYRWGLLQK